ncbi:MAG: 4Fe-4S binding protein [bacterium]|nr:4Fe-4S binding protein [bacterium]
MFPFVTTILRALRRGPATRRYPYEVRPPMAGSRGHLVNEPDTCIYCGLCVRRCPAGALAVTREPKSWTLDPYRCILCAYCVEVCPKKCLRMEPSHVRAAS